LEPAARGKRGDQTGAGSADSHYQARLRCGATRRDSPVVSCEGLCDRLGVVVSVTEGVRVPLPLDDCEGVNVAVGVPETDAVRVAEPLGELLRVIERDALAVSDPLLMALGDPEGDGVAVGEGERVDDAVPVALEDCERDGDCVGDALVVCEGDTETLGDSDCDGVGDPVGVGAALELWV